MTQAWDGRQGAIPPESWAKCNPGRFTPYIPPGRYAISSLNAKPDQPQGTDLARSLSQAIRLCDGAGFEAALAGYLMDALAADNLVILAYPTAGPPRALFEVDRAGAFARLESGYLAGAYLLDPIYDLVQTGAPAGVYRLSDVAPDAFQRSRYFQEYYRQTTILDELTYLARPRHGLTLTLCLGRDATSGSVFPARSLTMGRSIVPIVLALAERHWAGLKAETASAEDLPGRVAAALKARHGIGLSPRQAEVALLILRGHSTASIALRLQLSAQTVKVFRRQIHKRCGISTQAELFALMLPLMQG